jgi:hypothetical protein
MVELRTAGLLSGRHGTIVLITGDAGFWRTAAWCRQQGCVELAPPTANKGHCGARVQQLACGWHMTWEEFCSGGGQQEGPQVCHQASNSWSCRAAQACQAQWALVLAAGGS